MTSTTEQDCELSYRYWTHACSSLVFSVLRCHGQDFVADMERLSVRRHQQAHFLPGLAKLGLDQETNDVRRCALYHFFSNSLGGLPMHYVEERPDKIWIRYLAPFWMGDSPLHPSSGPAILGPAFGRAPFLGWHAFNGAFLGNPKLVFVHTQNLVEGEPWDGGYFTIDTEDHAPGEGYLRRPGEWGPPPDPATTPALPHASWPSERRLKARRTFAIEFMLSRIRTLCDLVGLAEAARLTERAFTICLAQLLPSICAELGLAGIVSAADGARCYAGLAAANGSNVDHTETTGAQRLVEYTRLWRTEPSPGEEIEQAIAHAWSAALKLYGSERSCSLTAQGKDDYLWSFA